MLLNDIDWLNGELCQKCEYMDNIKKDIDKFEEHSRRENIRVFGVSEDQNETPKRIKVKLLTYFRIASPDKMWSTRDMVRAHRTGSTADAENDRRPVIVRFLHWDDKMSIYQGREVLLSEGMRVADDLTQRQRQAFKKLKDSDQKGYFYKGELKISEPSQPTEGSCVFVRGRRQLNSGQNATNLGSATRSITPMPMEVMATPNPENTNIHSKDDK